VSREGTRASAGRATLIVSEADTAQSLGSGDLPVLGTPRVVALIEEAAVSAAASELEAGQTSVGVLVELQHLAPTRIGATVEAVAELVRSDGRTLEFEVSAVCEGSEIARGRHHRAVVGRERFLGRPELTPPSA
jgi:predicted thioesterase